MSSAQIQQRFRCIVRLGSIALALLVLLGACQGKPAPIKIYVTATPEPMATPVGEMTISRNMFPGPSPTGATDTPFPIPTAMPRTATNTAVASPRPLATATLIPTVTLPPTDPPPPLEPSFEGVPPAEQLPVLSSSRMGIQMHSFIEEEEWRQMLAAVDALGFGWVKIQIPWNELELAPGQIGGRTLATYLNRVRLASDNGRRKVLISIVRAPDWARPAGYDPALSGPPADPQLLADFILLFVNAVHPGQPIVSAVEVWNEPNLSREWNGAALDGGTYMRYFSTVYNTLHTNRPDIVLVTAGLAPGDVAGVVANDRLYLQQMINAGLTNYPDVRIGVHPYGWANPPDARCCTTERPWADNPVFYFQDTLFDYRDILTRSGLANRFWITEFGWGTYQGVGVGGTDVNPPPPGAEFFAYVTREQQAEYVVRALALTQQPPLSDFVEYAFLWNMNFAMLAGAIDNRHEQAGYSLLDAGGMPRLAFLYLYVSRRVP